ncbi:hypothetical protein CLOM_g17255 [Closterium sp. NIES-68]|nr:hypothetical protein CLOM_g17255 [Closterium sp. NIES-68]
MVVDSAAVSASAASGMSTASWADVSSITAANSDTAVKCCDDFDVGCDKSVKCVMVSCKNDRKDISGDVVAVVLDLSKN